MLALKRKGEEPRNDNVMKKSRGPLKKLCPRCATRNVKSSLELYQVTDTTAVFLCASDECLYQREVLRDYKVLHRLQGPGEGWKQQWMMMTRDKKEHNKHNENTAAIKDWTFEGKRSVDAFKCPLSFKEATPEDACTILKHAVSLVGDVMGKEELPNETNLACYKNSHQRRFDKEDDGLDTVDSLLRDHAEIGRHKEACGLSNFAARVDKEFYTLSVICDASTSTSPRTDGGVGNKYSTVDTAELFKKWFGDKFDLEHHGLPCGVVDLSRYSSAEVVPASGSQQDASSDQLDAWLNETAVGEWDLNDSFITLFDEDAKDPEILLTAGVEGTVTP